MASEIVTGVTGFKITAQYDDVICATFEPTSGDLYLTVATEEGFAAAFVKPKDAKALAKYILSKIDN